MNLIRHILQNYFQRWLGIFLGTVGFVATIIQLNAITLNFALISAFLLGCVIISVIMTYLTIPKRHFSEDVLPPEDERTKVATVQFPTSRELAIQASELGQSIFGSEDVGFEIFEQWRAKNTLITTCLTDRNNRFVGYFTILPLESAFAKRFIHDNVLGSEFEKAITPDVVLSEDEMGEARHLYFAGIAVKNANTLAGKRHAAILLWSIVEYMRQYFNAKVHKHLYAVPTTEDGLIIVKRLGFKLIREGSSKSRRHDLYEVEITADAIQRVAQSLLKVQHCCDFSSYQKYLRKWQRRLVKRPT